MIHIFNNYDTISIPIKTDSKSIIFIDTYSLPFFNNKIISLEDVRTEKYAILTILGLIKLKSKVFKIFHKFSALNSSHPYLIPTYLTINMKAKKINVMILGR